MIVLSEGFGASTAIGDFTSYGLLSMQDHASILTGGPLGDPYLQIVGWNHPSQGQAILRPLATPLAAFTFGARIRGSGVVTGQATNALIFLSSGSIAQFSVFLNSAGSYILVTRGLPSGTVIGGGPITSNLTSWNFMEVGATLSTTVGTVTIKINGVQVLALTGVNNVTDTGNITMAVVQMNWNNNLTPATMYITHIYITNNTAPNAGFLGDVRVFSRFPTANSAVAFTPNGLANNYQNAAAVPPVPATDYNSASSVGAQDTFSGPTLPTGLSNIFAVGIKSLVQDAAAGQRTVENVLISGATTVNGAPITPPVSPNAQYAIDIFNTDPNTSAVWTEVNAQATTFGYAIAT